MTTVDPHSGGISGANLVVLAAAAFIVSVGYGALIPVLPAWLTALQPSLPAARIAQQVGELSGIYMAGVFFGALAAGYLSDWIGRRPVLLGALVLFCLAVLATVHIESLASLYALRFIAGLSGAAVVPVSAAMIADGSADASVARRLATLGAASLVGFLVGPTIVSLPQILGTGVRWPSNDPAALLAFSMHATLAMAILVLVAVFRLAPVESCACEVRRSSVPKEAARSRFLPLLTLNFAILFGLGAFEIAVALDGSQRLQLDAVRISVMFAECSIVMLLINGILFLTPLFRVVAIRTLLVLGILAMIGGFLLLYHSSGYVTVLAAVAFIAAGSGIAMPTIAYASASNAARLGAAMGQLTAAGSLGQAIGSFAGGWMFALLSARTFLAMALFMSLTLVIEWFRARIVTTIVGSGDSSLSNLVQRK